MVVKNHILTTIKKLDRLYNSTPVNEATYYSKLAIIELCGWIELSMDNIAENFVNRYVKTAEFKKKFKQTKDKNNGFDYENNFSKMLIQTIGLHNMEKVETIIVSPVELTILKANLESLKKLRNDAAHTFIGTTTTYQAPSVTKSQLESIYPILKKIGIGIKGL